MDSRTARIYRVENDEEKAALEQSLRTRLIDLGEKEAAWLESFPSEKRAEELALSRFQAERKRLKGPDNVRIQNAFRLGYRAAVSDNTPAERATDGEKK